MDFQSVNSQNYNLFKLFLSNVPSIKDIDEDVINNAVIAVEDGKIVGCISYERYNTKGLIRYFIFKNIPESTVFLELFHSLEKKIAAAGMKEVLGVANDETTKDLFFSLGFNPLRERIIFLDELNLADSQFQNSTFMVKMVS